MDLERDGAQLFAGAGLAALGAAREVAEALPRDEAGIRLSAQPGLRALVDPEAPLGRVAEAALGPRARPVRAILFDKSAGRNWSLGWHQDRVICVKARREVPEFDAWTRKDGLLHVTPPVEILAAMITLRFHLDPVPEENAPLLVAPGSHRLGRIAEAEIDAAVGRCGIAVCLAEPGDIWAYSTLILHASEAATRPLRRRVLQVDYAASDLPDGLEWLGIG